jgi:pimeloyl-[acyl-carrier protein] synthase
VEQFNPTLARLNKDPYPVYRQYRESEPVHLGKALFPEYPESWYLFRHKDVDAVLRNRLFINDRIKTSDSSACPVAAPSRKAFWETLEQSLLLSDPPDHTRNRSLVSNSFSRQSAQQLIPFIRESADAILDRAIKQGEMDIVRNFAAPLPVVVIARIMGLQISDHEMIRTWSRPIADAMAPEATSKIYDDAMLMVNDFTCHLKQAFREKRNNPGDDMISSLLQAQGDGELDEDRLISMCSQIMVAGQETTIDAIGNSILALLQHPEQLEELQSNTGLIPNAAEELFRYNSPIQIAMVRFPTEDMEIGGQQIHKGVGVTAMLGSANHDPERFDNPEKLDITRNFKGRDVIFGQGIHRCLGAHLAQLELEIALETLLRRIKSIRLKSDQLQWRKNVVFRGLTSLPVSYQAS